MEDINESLDEAIRTKDIKSIRNILVTGIAQDPGFSKRVLERELKHCLDAGISKDELFEPFEGAPLNIDQNAWTKEYYAEQCTEFRYNFSLERLEHLKKTGRVLFPSKDAFGNEQPKRDSYSTSPEYEKEKRNYENTRRPRTEDKESEGIPKWLIPVGIGVAALILLWILFG